VFLFVGECSNSTVGVEKDYWDRLLNVEDEASPPPCKDGEDNGGCTSMDTYDSGQSDFGGSNSDDSYSSSDSNEWIDNHLEPIVIEPTPLCFSGKKNILY